MQNWYSNALLTHSLYLLWATITLSPVYSTLCSLRMLWKAGTSIPQLRRVPSMCGVGDT